MLSRSLRPPAFGRPGRATEQCNQPWGCQWWQSRPRCKATNRSQWSQAAVTAACKYGLTSQVQLSSLLPVRIPSGRGRVGIPRVPSSGVRAIKLIELARPRSAAAAGCDCDCRQAVLYCNCVSTYVQLASYSSAPKGACGGPSCARDRIHAAYSPEHCSSAASPVIHESAGHRALTTAPRAGPAGLTDHRSLRAPRIPWLYRSGGECVGLHKRDAMGTGR
jgi:hypothetical protein